MRDLPFEGRLDVALACLLSVERHHSVMGRPATRGRVAKDVPAPVERPEVPADCMADLRKFGAEVDRSLRRLLHAGWIQARTTDGTTRFSPREVTGPVVAWVRARLSTDARRLAEFESLDRAVTDR